MTGTRLDTLPGDAPLTRLGARLSKAMIGHGKLREHLRRVAEMAEIVSRAHGLPEHDVRLIRLAAELHDVGKTAMPAALLDKPGSLNEDEWVLMRRHTVIGERIIGTDPSLVGVARLVRSSHERCDGKGYPDGLSAAEIGAGASIIAVCDAYDAMVSDRIYRKARTREAALAELRRGAGTQFDPAIVELFCSTVEQHDERHACAGPRSRRQLEGDSSLRLPAVGV